MESRQAAEATRCLLSSRNIKFQQVTGNRRCLDCIIGEGFCCKAQHSYKLQFSPARVSSKELYICFLRNVIYVTE